MNFQAHGLCIRRGVVSKEEANGYKIRAVNSENHAHSLLMWEIRTHPRVLAAFSEIWGSTSLITSFDGVGYRSAGQTAELEWHVDQTDSAQRCVQGLIALTDSAAQNGGTQFAIGTHLVHDELVKGAHPQSWQFLAFQKDAVVGYRKCQPNLKAGDMLLWDSRLVHRVPHPRNFQTERVVAFVSMTPLSFATTKTLQRRRQAFDEGSSSTHWPHIFYKRKTARKLPPWPYETAPADVKRLIDGEGCLKSKDH